MSAVYETGEYLRLNPLWHVEESGWKVAQINRMLERNALHPSSICEVGCGAGEVLRQLQASLDSSCEFWGYDISPQAIELCQTRANERLHFERRDIVADRAQRFDLVLALDVAEHIDDYLGFLRSLATKGRHTMLHIPLDLSVQMILRRRGLPYVFDHYRHLHYFSKETALQMLAYSGHDVIDWFYTARAAEQPTDVMSRRLLRWPRRALFRVHPDLAARVLGGWSLLVLTRATPS